MILYHLIYSGKYKYGAISVTQVKMNLNWKLWRKKSGCQERKFKLFWGKCNECNICRSMNVYFSLDLMFQRSVSNGSLALLYVLSYVQIKGHTFNMHKEYELLYQ